MGFIKSPSNSLTKDGGFIGASIDLDRPAEVVLVKKVPIGYLGTVSLSNKSFIEEYGEFLENVNVPLTTSLIQDAKETIGSALVRNNNTKAIKFEILTKAIRKTDTSKYNKLGESITGRDYQRTSVFIDESGFVVPESSAIYEIVVNTKYLHIYILPAIDITRENYILTSKSNKTLGLSDVSDINVGIGVYSFSTANFSLKNNLNKYEFVTNPLKKGRTIFSADDIVIIRLPSIDYQMTNNDLYEGLETTFVGFVNDIRMTDKPASHTINISCEGMTKRLRFSRAITKQSLMTDDAQAAMIPLSAFSFPFSSTPADVSLLVKKMMIYSLSNIYEKDQDTKNYVGEFNEKFNKYNSYGSENKMTFSGFENSSEIAKVRDNIEFLLEGNAAKYFLDSTDTDNDKDCKIYTHDVNLAPIYEGNKLPICMLTGSSQKAYKLLFAKWEMYISEWAQVNKLIQEMADTVNFVFFDSEDGIIKFEQVNVSIEHLRTKQESSPNPQDSETLKQVKDTDVLKKKNAFWIKDMWVKERNILDGTSEIVNVITVTGSAVQEGQVDPVNIGARATVKNNKLIKKHGYIMGPTVSVLNLLDSKTCLAYGKSLLDRMNKKAASSATVRLVGNANLRAGYFCYLEEKNALFYIEKVSHSYNVGGNYDTEIELSYRREPVLRIDSVSVPGLLKANEISSDRTINFLKIRDKLDKDFDAAFAEVGLKSILLSKIKKSLKDMGYVDSEIDAVYTIDSLKYLYFNGFIWEHTIETDFSKFSNYVFELNNEMNKIKNNFIPDGRPSPFSQFK